MFVSTVEQIKWVANPKSPEIISNLSRMNTDTHAGRTQTYDASVLVEVSLDETKTNLDK